VGGISATFVFLVGLGQLSSFHFIPSYETGFYKPTNKPQSLLWDATVPD
jgi:hypothetical protein